MAAEAAINSRLDATTCLSKPSHTAAKHAAAVSRCQRRSGDGFPPAGGRGLVAALLTSSPTRGRRGKRLGPAPSKAAVDADDGGVVPLADEGGPWRACLQLSPVEAARPKGRLGLPARLGNAVEPEVEENGFPSPEDFGGFSAWLLRGMVAVAVTAMRTASSPGGPTVGSAAPAQLPASPGEPQLAEAQLAVPRVPGRLAVPRVPGRLAVPRVLGQLAAVVESSVSSASKWLSLKSCKYWSTLSGGTCRRRPASADMAAGDD
mmetsp:Transcript_91375/g.195939  ORF Transcript_91375/g.195939 Transcript_91375/m.195939 type:complete len:262 (-) Transcript_91375:896-1681(-)